MKKIIFSISTVAVFFVFSSSSCESESTKEKTEELGKQAAIEFCDCFKTSSKETCLNELTSKYSKSDYMSNNFIEAFNKQSPCGVTLEIIQLPTKAGHYEVIIIE